MHKNFIRSYSILAIVFVVFTVITMIGPFEKTAVFWVSYLFIVLAIVLQGYAIHIAFAREGTICSKFYGFPVAQVAFVYMVVQILFSILCMFLATIIPAWVVVVIDIIALGAVGIGLITTDAMRDEIERQDVKLKKDVSTMRVIQSQTRMLVGQCEDSEITEKLVKLAEAVQYSDPVSSEAIREIEDTLSGCVDELQKAVIDQEYDVANVLCKKTMDILAERNRMCKLNKMSS